MNISWNVYVERRNGCSVSEDSLQLTLVRLLAVFPARCSLGALRGGPFFYPTTEIDIQSIMITSRSVDV